jgi:hypothetical protein
MVSRDENIDNHVAEIRRPRLSILRNSGRVAVSKSLEVDSIDEDMVEGVESGSLPFNLNQELTNYQELWSNHHLLIETTLSDNLLATDFQNTLIAYANTINVPQAKKQSIAKMATTGFSRIVNLYVASGRLMVSGDDISMDQKFSGIINDAFAKNKEIRRVGGKVIGLFSPTNMHLKDASLTNVYHQLVELQNEAKKSYKPIYDLELKISNTIIRELSKNPNSAVQLLDSFLQCSDSEIGVEKTFARFLANHYELFGQKSELGIALNQIESSSTTNIFSEDFIGSEIAKNDGDNLMSFVASKILNQEKSFIQLMSETFNDWPQEYRLAYQTYISDKLRDYSLAIQKQVQLTKHKSWMMTDLASVEETVDRYWDTLLMDPPQPEFRVDHKRQNGRVSHRSKLSVDDVSSDILVEPPLPVKQVIEVRRNQANQFETQNDLSVQEIITRQLGIDARAERLVPIYLQVIESLKNNPFPSKGVASVAHTKANHIIIDNKRTKIYRVNPVGMPGIKVPRELQGGRIIYAVNKDNLIIVGAFSNHREYDHFLVSL